MQRRWSPSRAAPYRDSTAMEVAIRQVTVESLLDPSSPSPAAGDPRGHGRPAARRPDASSSGSRSPNGMPQPAASTVRPWPAGRAPPPQP
ncbi:hypothetical protein U9M48_026542 [Paspalum notatum var. saurae]|uniref:Uncharacterized protein n=1 Tax=Paspalum notatum var. saurae TaxID=547442 RepID=A0AAQ3WYC4_PASNO